jgi:hypothetical protein
MTAMCLDLSFINKFIISWGIFLTIVLPIHVIMLGVYSVASLFTSDYLELEYIQKNYVDSVMDFLLSLTLVGLFYYLGMRSQN